MSSFDPIASLLPAGLALGLVGCGLDGEPDDQGDPYADAVSAFDPAPDSFFGHEQLPDIVLGPPRGGFDVASLGCAGAIELEFEAPGIVDGPGPDLIVFENPFDASFPEPGEVSVSADGISWTVFPCDPLTLAGCAGISPTLALPDSGIDPRDVELAGGDAFDLASADPALAEVRFVRIVDRSQAYWEAQGQSYCDPGQQGAGGFDLDAVVAVHHGLLAVAG